MMINEEWKKNDALMKAAMKKMGLKFKRNTKTWEVNVGIPYKRSYIASFDENDNLVDEGPNTPESLGTIKYFVEEQSIGKLIPNIFFGVKSYEELKIKLDLMA